MLKFDPFSLKNLGSYLLLVFSLLVLSCTSVHAQTWQSNLVSMDEEGCLHYTRDFEQNAIPDFSYAGYKNGEEPWPLAEVKVTISPISGDNTDHIQDAIDQVAALSLGDDNMRGAVLLEVGQYNVSGQIFINASGVVLRGVGDGEDPTTSTIIYATGNTPAERDVIVAGGGNRGERWRTKSGNNVNIVSDFVAVGERSFVVEDGSQFAEKDNIIIHHPCSQGWLDAIDGGGAPTEGSWEVNQYNIVYNRYIDTIRGDTIIVHTPVYNHLDRSLSQSYIYTYDNPDQLRNIGIEHLRVDIESATPTSEDHAKNCVTFSEVEDAWASHCTFEHFFFAGVTMGTASRITIDHCNAINTTGIVEGGNQYNFNCQNASNNILIQHCYANLGRHAYTSNGVTEVSSMVIYNCESEDPYTSSEGHRHWTTGMLFDNFRDYGNNPGRVLGFYNRGDYGTRHGWANAHSVAWNCDVRRESGSGQLLVQKPPTAQNYAIGCFGTVNGDGPFEGPEGYIEGTNLSGLEPASLYEAQLNCRLGGDQFCYPVLASTDDGNVASNVLDDELDTRWSAEGEGEYLEFCFEESITVKGLQIAFYQGDQRQSYFDIEVSESGQSWELFQSGFVSSGTILGLENFSFGSSVVAKKLRIVGRGNSQSSWNSITEVELDTGETAVGIQQARAISSVVFPNPISGGEVLYIGENLYESNITLVDPLGRIHFQQRVVGEQFRIPVLESGVYHLHMESPAGLRTELLRFHR